MKPVKCSGTIDGVRTLKDGGLRVTVDTPILGQDLMADLFQLKDKLGWVIFAPNGTPEIEIPSKKVADFKEPKTPGQRLRATIWRWWESEGKPGDSERFYEAKIEVFIDWVKQKMSK